MSESLISGERASNRPLTLGAAVRGSQAEEGHRLVGYAHTNSGHEPVLVIPLAKGDERRCIVVTQSGDVFLGEDNWLQSDFWDVTGVAEIEPDMSTFRLERGPPRIGEIALNAQGKILLGFYRQTITEAGWLDIGNGTIVTDGGALVRFPAWQIVARQGDQRTTLFAIKRVVPSVSQAA